VALTFLDSLVNGGDQPLLLAEVSENSTLEVTAVEHLKGSTSFVGEVQKLTLSGFNGAVPTGTFALSFNSDSTVQLPANADPDEVLKALTMLPSLRSQITVTRSSLLLSDMESNIDGYVWTITFNEPGPRPLIGSLCMESVDKVYLEDCPLNNANTTAVVSRLVPGVTPIAGTFRLALEPRVGYGDISGMVTQPLFTDATADEVRDALAALPRSVNATVLRHPNAGAEYGLAWSVSLHDVEDYALSVVETILLNQGTWCIDNILESTSAKYSCDLPNFDSGFYCTSGGDERIGHCSASLLFMLDDSWGGCKHCPSLETLMPMVYTTRPRSRVRLTGASSIIVGAMARITYRPRDHWNSWTGGHDDITAIWEKASKKMGDLGCKVNAATQVLVSAINDPPILLLPQVPMLTIEGREVLLDHIHVEDPDLEAQPDSIMHVTVEAEMGRLYLRDSVSPALQIETPDWQGYQRLVINDTITHLRSTLSQLYYYPPRGLSTGTNAKRARREVQRVTVNTQEVAIIQSVTTLTSGGFIEGNFSLSMNCHVFIEELEAVFITSNLVNRSTNSATAVNSSVVWSPLLAADAPASGNESVEAGVNSMLAECFNLSASHAEYLIGLNSSSNSSSLSEVSNLRLKMLTYASVTTVVRRSGADLHGGYTWAVTFVDVPHSLPIMEVYANNLVANGTGPVDTPYSFNLPGILPKPSVSVNLVQAGHAPSEIYGTFTLALEEQQASAPISIFASANDLRAHLIALPEIGDVIVASGSAAISSPLALTLGRYWDITFLPSGIPPHAGDLPNLVVNGSGLQEAGATVHVVEMVKGWTPIDMLTVTANDLGNFGEGGARQVVAACPVNIVPEDVAPTVTIEVDGFLHGLGGSVIPLPLLHVSHTIAWEVAEEGAGQPQYLIRLSCSKGNVSTPLAALGSSVMETVVSSTVRELTGSLDNLNKALSRLVFTSPFQSRGIVEVHVWAKAVGSWTDGGWGSQTFHILLEDVNSPPVLTGPRILRGRGSAIMTIAGIRTSDDNGEGIVTMNISARHGLVHLPHPQRLLLQGIKMGYQSVAASGSLDAVASVLAKLSYSGPPHHFSGNDTINITVADDGGLSSAWTVNVILEAESIPPVIGLVGALAVLPGPLHVFEDGVLWIDTIELSEIDLGQESAVTLELSAAYGILSLGDAWDEGRVGVRDHGMGLSLSGNLHHVNLALQSLAYRPHPDLWGSDEISVLARSHRRVAGAVVEPVASVKTLAVIIEPVNDPPRIVLPTNGVAMSAWTGESLPLIGILIEDPDADEAGDGFLVVNVSTGTISSSLSISPGTTIHGRVPGVVFSEGSPIGLHHHLAFVSSLANARKVLSSLEFHAAIESDPGFQNIIIEVSDSGNWGLGGERYTVANLTVEVKHRLVMPGQEQNAMKWVLPATDLKIEEDGILEIWGLDLLGDDVGDSPKSWVEVTIACSHGSLQLHGAEKNEPSGVNITHEGSRLFLLIGPLRNISMILRNWLYLPDSDFFGIEVIELSALARAGNWVINSSLPVHVLGQPDLPSISIVPADNAQIIRREVEVGGRLPLLGLVLEHVDAIKHMSESMFSLCAWSVAGNETLHMNPFLPGLWVSRKESVGTLIVKGTLSHIQAALTSGALEYAPPKNLNGVDIVVLKFSEDRMLKTTTALISDSGDSQGAVIELEVFVSLPYVPSALVLGDGAAFLTEEGHAVKMTGVSIRAPRGHGVTETATTTVSFASDDGSITFPGAEGENVSVLRQGTHTVHVTGLERDINLVLAYAVFKANAFFNGVATVNVQISHQSEDTKTERKMYVSVTAANNPPSVYSPAVPISMKEDSGPVTLVGVFVTDPDAHELVDGKIKVSLQVKPLAAGQLSFKRSLSSVAIEKSANIGRGGSISDSGILTLYGELNKVNVVLQGLQFTASRDFNGMVHVLIEVNDRGFTGQGGPLSGNGSLQVEVEAINDAPQVSLPISYQRTDGQGALLLQNITVEDVDGLDSVVIKVIMYAERGSITAELLPMLSSESTTVAIVNDRENKSVSITGLLADIKRTLSHIWYQPQSEGWEGGDIVHAEATDEHGDVGHATTLVTILNPAVRPQILLVNDTFVAVEGEVSRLRGLSVFDPVVAAAILIRRSMASFTVSISAMIGRVGLSAVPPGLSPLPGSKWPAEVIAAGKGLNGLFGTPRKTLVFCGTLAAVNTALDALVYLSDNSTHIDVVVVEVERSGKPDGMLDRYEFSVNTLGVRHPPVINWPGNAHAEELPLSNAVVLRGISVEDSDLPQGKVLTVQLETTGSVGNISLTNAVEGVLFQESNEGLGRAGTAFRGNLSIINAVLSDVVVYLEPQGLTSLTPVLIVRVSNSDAGASLEIPLMATTTNTPPTVKIEMSVLGMMEGGLLERAGEQAGIKVEDKDVRKIPHGFLNVEVLASHKSVLEVQNVTTSASQRDPIQTVRTFATGSSSSSNMSLHGKFNLSLDFSGLCNGCGVEGTGPIWHNAVPNEDDVRSGLGTGYEDGESLQNKLMSLTAMQVLGIKVFCQRDVQPGLFGSHEWRITFMGAPATLPALVVVNHELSGPTSSGVEIDYVLRGIQLSGSFLLSLGGFITTPIRYDSTSVEVATALEALPSISAVKVSTPVLSDTNGGRTWLVTFFNALNGGDLPLLIANSSRLNGNGATIKIVEEVKGTGVPELWEIKSSAEHINQIVAVTLTGLRQVKGYFQLGLDYGRQLAQTKPIYPEAVGSAEEESGVWLFGGTPGHRRGESVQSRLLGLANWSLLGPAADVKVSRTVYIDEDSVTWSITFIAAPEDLPVMLVWDKHLSGEGGISVDALSLHNKVGGFFSLSYGEVHTLPLAHDSSGEELSAALNALSSLHSSDSGAGVVVAARASQTSLEGGQRWTVAFLHDPEVPLMLRAVGTASRGLSGSSAQVSSRRLQHGGYGASLCLADPSGVSFPLTGSSKGSSLAFRGSSAHVSQVLSSLSYSPRQDWHGSVDIIIRVNDNGFTGFGGPQSGWGSFSVLVAPVDNPPVVYWCGKILQGEGAFLHGIDEDVSLKLEYYDCLRDSDWLDPTEFSHVGLSGGGPGLRIQDADSEGSTFQARIFLVTITADTGDILIAIEELNGQAQGTSSRNPLTLCGVLERINTILKTLEYRPREDWHGWDRIVVDVADVSKDIGYIGRNSDDCSITSLSNTTHTLREIFIFVAAVNDPPVVEVSNLIGTFVVQKNVLSENQQRAGFLVQTEEDKHVDILGVRIQDVDTVASGKNLSLPQGFHAPGGGTRVGDGTGMMAFEPEIGLELSCEHGNLSLSGSAVGLRVIEGDPLMGSRKLVFAGGLAGINLCLERGIRYTPDADWNGIDGLEVSVNDRGNGGKTLQSIDGSLNDSILLVVDVSPVNDSPRLIVPLMGDENESLTAHEDSPGMMGTDCCPLSLLPNLQGASIISNSSILLEDPDIPITASSLSDENRWTLLSQANKSSTAPIEQVELKLVARYGAILLQDVLSDVTLTGVSSGTDRLVPNGFMSELQLTGPMWAVSQALRGMIYQSDRNWNSWGWGGPKSDTVTYRELSLTVHDAWGSSASAVVRFLVLPENDLPVIDMTGAQYDPLRQTHDGLSATVVGVDVIIAREDVDTLLEGLWVRDVDLGHYDDKAMMEVTLYASNGTLSLPGGVSLAVFLAGDGHDDQSISFRASLPNINRALSGLTYRGRQDFFGTDEVIITVSDLGHHGQGILCSRGARGRAGQHGLNYHQGGCPQSDTLTVPILILSEPDEPIIHFPSQEYLDAVEDSDLVVVGLHIDEKDGMYAAGEMDGFIFSDLDEFQTKRIWPGQVRVEILVDHGQLTLSTTVDLSFEVGDGVADERMVLYGHPGDINHAFDRMVYRGDVHWNTLGRPLSRLTISVSNSHSGLGGVEPIAVHTIFSMWVRVVAVNDPPRVQLSGQVFRPVSPTFWPELGEAEVAMVQPLETMEDVNLEVLGVSVSDVDLDERQGATVLFTMGSEHGMLYLAFSDGLGFVSGDVSQRAAGVYFSNKASFHGGLANTNTALHSLVYIPNPNWNGNDTLTFAVNDQGWSAQISGIGLQHQQVVSVIVHPQSDPPFLEAPSFPLQAEEDMTSVVHGVRVTDPDGEAWIRVAISTRRGSVGLPQASNAGLQFEEGTGEGEEKVVVIGPESALNAALSKLVYTPPTHWTSMKQGDAIQILCEDPSGLTAHATVVVIVASRHNDPPQVHVPGATYVEEPCEALDGRIGDPSPQHPAPRASQCRRITSVARLTVEEDVTSTIEGVYIEDPDVEEGGLEASIDVEISTSHGLLGFSGSTMSLGVAFMGGTQPNLGHRIEFRGILSFVNVALARLTYSADPDWYGMDEIVITVDDRGFTGAGGPRSDSRVIPMDVAPRNDPPVLIVTAQSGKQSQEQRKDEGLSSSIKPPPTMEVIEDGRITLHNVTLYDAEVNPRQLHEQVLGLPSPGTPYEEYPGVEGGSGEGLYRVTVESEHGRIIFPWTAKLAFAAPAWELEEEIQIETSPFTQGATYLTESSEEANFTTGRDGGGNDRGFGAPGSMWWRAARFIGSLEDCNRALEAMSYWPNLNWNGIDTVRIRADEVLASARANEDYTNSVQEDTIYILVRVTPVNDPPVVTPPFPQRDPLVRAPDLLSMAAFSGEMAFINEDQPLHIPGFTIRDVDLWEVGGPDADIIVTLRARHGKVFINMDEAHGTGETVTAKRDVEGPILSSHLSGLIFLDENGMPKAKHVDMGGARTLTFSASLNDANIALSSLVFLPNKDFFGPGARIIVEAWDHGLSGSTGHDGKAGFGSAQLNWRQGGKGWAYVPVIVHPVNDPPMLSLPMSEDGQARLWIDEKEERRLDGARWHSAIASSVMAAGYLPHRTGTELWRSQGVFPGLDAGSWGKGKKLEWKNFLVADINEGLGDGSPCHFVSWGGYLFFQAGDSTHGRELWRTDGTSPGTVLVKDIYPGMKGGNPSYLTPFKGFLYFQAGGIDTSWMIVSQHQDECGGFRQSSFEPRVFFAKPCCNFSLQDTKWEASRRFDCPDGYHWASSQEGFNLFPGRQAENREMATMEPLVYFGQCGWDGYKWGGQSRTHFRFSDSQRTGAYKHAGHRESYRPDKDVDLDNLAILEFAGVVCVANFDQGSDSVDVETVMGQECRSGERSGGECHLQSGTEL
ncbi:unnamed protein product, partial [Choristocarpus tenellus]